MALAWVPLPATPEPPLQPGVQPRAQEEAPADEEAAGEARKRSRKQYYLTAGNAAGQPRAPVQDAMAPRRTRCGQNRFLGCVWGLA